MSDLTSAIRAQRLDAAGTRDFTQPGAGAIRRAAITEVTEEWLSQLYQEAIAGSRGHGVALAAVGSLGRGDSGPLSDLDLILVHDGRALKDAEVAAVADQIWYPIWDAGMKLDHSVRTISQCRSVAADDLTATVGLLDIRPIVGDTEIVAAVRSTIAHDWRSGARKRLPELLEGMRSRHERQGELSQAGEPDLKEARGGLRDYTVLGALTAAWLTDRPRGEVDAAHQHLLDVRDALHVVTGKGRDRLGREDRDAVAALLGYTDPDDLLTAVSSSARTIAWALDSTVRRASQSQRARTLRVGPRRPSMTPIGYGLFRHDGEAVLGSTSQVSSDPLLPLRAAVIAARSELPLSPQTLTNLAQCPPLPVPWPQAARDLFADLLATGPGLLTAWEGLDQVGIIDGWIPQWEAVRSRPQHNAVHRHTVDRHILQTVIEAAARSRDVARPDLLLFGALLHDIGKIAGSHDHSVEGAKIAAAVCKRWGLTQADTEEVVLLVREHLTLIELATRRDLSDPATLHSVSSICHDQLDTFELLRALTISDAVAAGPKAWTDWRATLMEHLTAKARPALADHLAPSMHETTAPTAEQVEQVAAGQPVVEVSTAEVGFTVVVIERDRQGLFADTAGLLAAYGLTVRRAVVATVDGIARNEWSVESPGGDAPEARRIVSGLARLAHGDRSALAALDRQRLRRAEQSHEYSPTRALVAPGGGEGVTIMEVRAQDRPGLLHDLGAALAAAGLSVRSAHISTYAGQTLDTFYLSLPEGGALPPAKVAQAVTAVIDACDHRTS